MDLTTYVDNLGHELAALIETGGHDAGAVVERLGGSLESAVRLTLLDALSAAADEITRDLAPGSVELRLRGRDPNFVVTPPPAEQSFERELQESIEAELMALPDHDARYGATMAPDGASGNEEGATARINFRLPEPLKAAIEEAAAKEGRSVNAWLVRVASAALQHPDREPPPAYSAERRGKRGSQRYTGWVR